MIKKEPRIRFGDIFAAMFVAMGLLFLLTAIHVIAINSTGDTQIVLNTVFILGLRIFITLIIIGIAGVTIHLLRYMVWQITTPKWLKEKAKRGRNV